MNLRNFAILITFSSFGLGMVDSTPIEPTLKPDQPDFPDSIPGEPFNPSEFEAASKMDYDENTMGFLPYTNEKRIQERLAMANKNGLIDDSRLWAKFGEFVFIPYMISSHFSRPERHVIVKAFDNFHENTCIRFVPWTHQKDYIYIVYGNGCDSDAGRVGGEQTISLGKNCNYTYVAIHEINHAVGFWHEHNRPDRGNHINVYLENVKPENRFNFDKLSSKIVHSFGQKYDTSSIMHYDQYAFSIDPKSLIVLEPFEPNDDMGYAKELSKTDIAKINKMYHCKVSTYKPKLDNPILSDLKINNCQDSYPNCQDLPKGKGSCNTNIWMQANCKKFCDLCDSPCQDLHKKCRNWALRGACQTQLDYMYIYCPKSCLECQ